MIRLKDLIAPTFRPVYDDIKALKHAEYWEKGGRGSTKSSFISMAICCGLMWDRDANAIIYRRVGNTLKDSVYSQMLWALDMLGISEYWKPKASPLEIVNVKTGQRILFRGADDPLKSKSIKLAKGYFKYLWFEELAEFRSMEDIRSIKQSVLRGNRKACTIYSYNPPRSAQNWVNAESLVDRPDRLVHASSYLDVDPEWLGETFLAEANALARTNERAYRNEYLGEVTGNGGNVFENLEVRDIPQEEIDTLQTFCQGIDWGYFPDPFAWVRCGFDPRSRTLYIIDECVLNRMGNREAYDRIKDKLRKDETLIADSAEPKSVNDFKEYGAWWIRGAVKGPGSVDYSMKWLASLSKIIIDRKCTVSAREFTQYEYLRNSRDEFIEGYPDKDNHMIDATRYALSTVWKQRGQ